MGEKLTIFDPADLLNSDEAIATFMADAFGHSFCAVRCALAAAPGNSHI